MANRRTKSRWEFTMGLWLVTTILVIGTLTVVVPRPAAAQTPAEGSLQVSITVSPPTVSAGSPFTVTAQVSGGAGPYSFNWNSVPPGCNPTPSASWSCSIGNSGMYQVGVMVSNATAQGSATQYFNVTSNSGGNGNQGNSNNNNNNGNNGSNGFNLSAFGPILVYALIGGLIGFALLVALTVGVVMIAVILARRLPKPPKGGQVCPACQAAAPPGAKFCPACGAPLGPAKK